MDENRTENKVMNRRLDKLDESMVCMMVGSDLTYRAQEGQLKPVIGRNESVDHILALLSRRGMKNVILTGDPGVGKTVLIEEIANRIANGDVPSTMSKVRIIQTSFSEIWGYVANSEDWGKYLNTLKKLLTEIHEMNAILFMDEIHSIFGHPYSMAYLRPYLTEGTLTIIGATTDHEYYTFINKDQATARRFAHVRIEEASETTTIAILEKELSQIESIYGCGIENEEVIKYLIKLSNAFIPYRSQPSKALEILDQVVVSKSIRNDTSPIAKADIQKAISQAVNIPEEAISAPKERLEAMENILNAHILGQEQVISRLCRRLLISKASVCVTPERPDGVFMLAGPTGVGKTELAKALSTYLTGSDKNLIRLDMSAFSGEESIYSILGYPGKQGTDDVQNVPLLTRQLRAQPYSVLLLDEIEKAHKVVRLLFLHAFDTGKMIDNIGNEIFLRNTVIIMTTNVGFSVRKAIISIPGQTLDRNNLEYEHAATEKIKEEFPQEFLGRIDDILFFKPLTKNIMNGFVGQKIRCLEQITGKKLNATQNAIKLICEKGFHPEYGARDLNRAVDELLGYKLALLKFSVDWDSISSIKIDRSKTKDELKLTAI